jgi:hypothetical protein
MGPRGELSIVLSSPRKRGPIATVPSIDLRTCRIGDYGSPLARGRQCVGRIGRWPATAGLGDQQRGPPRKSATFKWRSFQFRRMPQPGVSSAGCCWMALTWFPSDYCLAACAGYAAPCAGPPARYAAFSAALFARYAAFDDVRCVWPALFDVQCRLEAFLRRSAEGSLLKASWCWSRPRLRTSALLPVRPPSPMRPNPKPKERVDAR